MTILNILAVHSDLRSYGITLVHKALIVNGALPLPTSLCKNSLCRVFLDISDDNRIDYANVLLSEPMMHDIRHIPYPKESSLESLNTLLTSSAPVFGFFFFSIIGPP